jgi:N-carbamoyl-L-amino-acid hydrolase
MLALAELVTAARSVAVSLGARLTVGRVQVEPNGSNATPARVTAWLDARAEHDSALDASVDEVSRKVRQIAAQHGVIIRVHCDSCTRGVTFLEPMWSIIGGP